MAQETVKKIWRFSSSTDSVAAVLLSSATKAVGYTDSSSTFQRVAAVWLNGNKNDPRMDSNRHESDVQPENVLRFLDRALA